MTMTDAIHHAVLKVPDPAWTPAVELDGEIRDGAGPPNSRATAEPLTLTVQAQSR
ncbi:hypothetical protein [Streptomyces cadmiisoli]|uniref:hypothetical protein n=1 Tax=Streptomyces cadmiisoli TaxID=2184053 RepID=UPI003D70ABCC